MPLACKYCIMTRGLKGSEINNFPKTEEELFQHIEKEHHIPVRGKRETKQMCLERFKKENPEAFGPNCKCPSCKNGAMKALDKMLARGKRKFN